MRRKYLSLFLAAAIALTQIAGTGQMVQASEVGQEVFGEVFGADGEDVSEETGYQPYLNFGEELRMLPGKKQPIRKLNGGWWQLKNSEGIKTIPMEITDVGSKNPDIVSVGEYEEETGEWNIEALKLGEATLTVTCIALQDASADNAVNIQPVEKDVRVVVSDKIYILEVEDFNSSMHPGDSVNITAEVSAWDANMQEADAADAVITWKASSEYSGFSETTGEGNSFQVQAPEGGDAYNINVTAEVRRGDEKVAAWNGSIGIFNTYYKLDMGLPEGIEEIWPGETVEITPMLYRYELGKERVPETEAKIQFIYNEEMFDIQKNGMHVESGTFIENGSFFVKKLKNYPDLLQISAYMDELQRGYGYVSFQQKNYSLYDVSIKGGTDENYTYLLVDDDDPTENDTDTVFTLDTSKLSGDYEIEWLLECENGAVDKNVYKVSGEKGEFITINPKALKDDLKMKAGGAEEEFYYYSCSLFGIVKVGGEEQGRACMEITVRKPDYTVMDGDGSVLKGSVFTYKDGKLECEVFNKEYRGYQNLMLDIKEMNILEQTPQNTNVFALKKDGNDLLLVAENYGTAVIEYRVVLPSGREKVFISEKSVEKDMYDFDMVSSTRTTNLLPGAEAKLETEVWHGFYNEKTQTEEWEKLEPSKYTITFENYNQDVISVGEDGTVKAVGESGSGYLRAKCTIPQDSGEEYVEWNEEEFYVIDSYHQLMAKEFLVTPGQVVNSVDVVWKMFDLEHRDGLAAMDGFSYQLFERWGAKVNEEGTGFTVDSDVREGKRIRISMRAEKEDSNGRKVRAFGTLVLTVSSQNVCSHNFVQKSLKPATCIETGTRVLECSKCHAVTKTETIPAAGHKPGSLTVVKEATCTEAGLQQQKCTVCGQALDTRELPKTGHSFGEWTGKTKPTALQEGIEARTCKTCKAEETRKTNKLKAVIKLNVKKIPLQVKKSTIAVKVVSMTEGDGIKSWKSNKPKVASVTSKGKITGKKAGTAKITVTLKSGVSASVTVIVQQKAVVTTKLTVTGKSVKKNKLTLKKGKSVTLAAVQTPVTSTEKITYISSNKKIAAVTSKGKVTGKKPGKAKITVKSGKKKVAISVTVKK